MTSMPRAGRSITTSIPRGPAEAVIARMGEAVIAGLGPPIDDPVRSAPQKLDLVFATIGNKGSVATSSWRSSRSGCPTTTRSCARSCVGSLAAQMAPLLARILRQGKAEGSMAVADPDDTALVVVSCVLGPNELAGQLFVAYHGGTAELDAIMRTFAPTRRRWSGSSAWRRTC